MRYLLVAVAVLLATPAHAQSLRQATETFAVAATADWMSTRALLKRGGVEKNPAFRWAQTKPDAMIALGAAADVAAVVAWNKTVGKRRPKLAAVGLYAASALRVWLTARNIQSRGREPSLQPWGGLPPTWRTPNSRVFSPGRS